MDLTGTGTLRRIVKHPLFPDVLQWVTLGVFAMLIAVGWNYHGIRGIDIADPLAYTNLATLLFWVIWFMGLILLVPIIGRLWCTVCPLGYINDLLARVGLRRRYPRALRNLYLAAVLLVLYNGLVAFYKINRFPDLSARLLLVIVLMVILVGLVFRGRIFCGYLCPVGAMVGVYSRVSPWHLTVRDRSVCQSCESKACYLGEKRWYQVRTPLLSFSFPVRRPGCQVDLFPPEMVEDPRCVMCTQCIKNCPFDNIRWGTRPFLRGVVNPGVPTTSEAVFLTFLLGSTLTIFTRVWPPLNAAIYAPANFLVGNLGFGSSAVAQGLTLLWVTMALPLIVVALLAALARFMAESTLRPLESPPAGPRLVFNLPGRDEQREATEEGWRRERLTARGVFSTFALSFIPVVLGAHAAFALIKVNEKIAYLGGALRDPTGVKFYLSIHTLGIMAAPQEMIPLPIVRWISLLLVVAGAAASLGVVDRLAQTVYGDLPAYRRWGRNIFLAANGALGALLLVLVVKWLF